MKQITNIEVLRTYWEVISSKEPEYKGHELEYLPDQVKGFVQKDGMLHPRHVGQDIIRGVFLDAAKRIEPDFKLDQYATPVVEALCMYIGQDENFLRLGRGFNFSKGILISGKTGCGKTLLLKAMSITIGKFSRGYFNYAFDILPAYRIVADYVIKGYEDVFPEYNVSSNLAKNVFAIDDLGSENDGTHYGHSTNVVGEIFLRRYDLFQVNKMICTHATTNLDKNSLEEFYGQRVYSRFKETFNDLILTGDDRRGTVNNRENNE